MSTEPDAYDGGWAPAVVRILIAVQARAGNLGRCVGPDCKYEEASVGSTFGVRRHLRRGCDVAAVGRSPLMIKPACMVDQAGYRVGRCRQHVGAQQVRQQRVAQDFALDRVGFEASI